MTEAQTAMSPTKINDEAINQLFREARTHTAWLPNRIPADILRQVYELTRWGPTSANSTPARFVFLESEAAKARLLPALAPLNVEKTKSAPVTVIVAWDTEFYENLPRLFPHTDMRSYFAGNPALIHETAFRNGSLQGGYFISPREPWDLTAAPCPASTRRK